MIRLVAVRLARSAIVLVAVTVATFLLVYLMGDPVYALVPLDSPPDVVETTRQHFGLDRPIYVQYMYFVRQALQGNLGDSFRYRRSALSLVLQRLPATIQLTLASMGIATMVAMPVGILSAVKRRGVLDYAGLAISTLAIAVPPFWLGIMLILLFADYVRWFPPSGKGSLSSLVLPAIAMSAYNIGLMTRLVRSSMLEELGREYITTARSKGLPEATITYRHALRNALIPTVTVVGLQFGRLIGGSVIIETVFAWPGVGRLMMQAIDTRDLPVIRSVVLVVALCFILINLLVDISYAYLDPRIGHATGSGDT